MAERIAAAHLVIGRSGASTISELGVIGRPSILVPLPQSLDNDQKANAEKLAQTGAGWMIEQKDFTATALATRLEALFTDPAGLETAAGAARAQGQPNAGRGEYRALRGRGRGRDARGGPAALLFAAGGA